jgi:phosphatidylglycerol---prolipoprotein diacylglyceryl transferase
MIVDFDPVLFSIGPLQVRWYGLMYVIGFLIGGQILKYLCRKRYLNMAVDLVDQYVTYLLIGMFICARLFYVFIYNWDETEGLIDVIAVWRGGLSFHGAAIGFVIATLIFSKRHKVSLWELMDSMTLAVPQGLFFGRLGNFINGELYGRPTDSAFGMVFASDPQKLTRHPSQLYQAFTEGILLMAILWIIKPYLKKPGLLSPLFLVFYGLFRYTTEFFREADPQLGYYFAGTTTMGQILCLLMIAAGSGIFFWNLKKNR